MVSLRCGGSLIVTRKRPADTGTEMLSWAIDSFIPAQPGRTVAAHSINRVLSRVNVKQIGVP